MTWEDIQLFYIGDIVSVRGTGLFSADIFYARIYSVFEIQEPECIGYTIQMLNGPGEGSFRSCYQSEIFEASEDEFMVDEMMNE